MTPRCEARDKLNIQCALPQGHNGRHLNRHNSEVVEHHFTDEELSEPEARSEPNVWKYFLPQLPVPPRAAVYLVVGMALLLTLPVWGLGALVLGVVWLAYALGEASVKRLEAGVIKWGETMGASEKKEQP